MFLLYLIVRFRALNASIGVSMGTLRIVLHQGYPFVCDETALKDYLYSNPDSLYLHDPQLSHQVPVVRRKGVTIITTSVDPANLVSIKHKPKEFLYMPVWSVEELIDCSKTCYSDITSVDTVKKRFHFWGGSARNCFTTSDNEIRSKLETILKEVHSVEALISRLEASMHDGKSDESFQWLRHIHTDESYTRQIYDWPSPYIRRRVLMQLREIESTFINRLELLANGSYIKSGQLYKDYVTHRLQFGPPFPLTAVSIAGTCEITFPSGYCLFSNTDKITCSDSSRLYIPLEGNKESIDLIIPPFMLQVTAAKTHAVKEKGVSLVKKAFPIGSLCM